jgi:ssRNA-specific RNase YbeY (16S rRNA maturation enzyme)
MKINIYSVKSRSQPGSKKLRMLVRKVLANEESKFETVNIILADDPYLRRLNNDYFKKNRTTNVISFNLGAIAEVYVSAEQANDFYELCYFVVHGLLHAVGYDHPNRKGAVVMSKKCREYLADE